RARLGVAARVALDAECIEQTLQRTDEAHREKDELGRDDLLGPGHFDHLAALPLDAHGLERSELAAFAEELLGRDRELALAALFMARRGAQLGRPVRPYQRLVLVVRRHRQQLELGDALRAMAVAGADAVAAGVAAA